MQTAGSLQFCPGRTDRTQRGKSPCEIDGQGDLKKALAIYNPELSIVLSAERQMEIIEFWPVQVVYDTEINPNTPFSKWLLSRCDQPSTCHQQNAYGSGVLGHADGHEDLPRISVGSSIRKEPHGSVRTIPAPDEGEGPFGAPQQLFPALLGQA